MQLTSAMGLETQIPACSLQEPFRARCPRVASPQSRLDRPKQRVFQEHMQVRDASAGANRRNRLCGNWCRSATGELRCTACAAVTVARQTGRLELQAAGLLSFVRRPPHGTDRRAAGRPRHPPCAGAPVFLASSMSDGTLRALGLLLAIHQLGAGGEAARPPSLTGLEEPETALHPAAEATPCRAGLFWIACTGSWPGAVRSKSVRAPTFWFEPGCKGQGERHGAD